MFNPASAQFAPSLWPWASASLLVALLLPLPSAAQTTFSDSSSGNWNSVAGTWNIPSLVPGSSDTVNIGSFTITVSDVESAGVLSLSGGAITGEGSLSIAGSGSAWTGGNLNSLGTLTILSGADLHLSSAGSLDFYGAMINNGGAVSWSAGTLRTGNGGSFTNNGSFTDSASSSVNNPWGGAATFTNALGGTYNKTAGTTDFQIPFVNSGAVNVTGGTLNLDTGGTLNGGSSLSATGGTIQLTGGIFAASGTVAISNVIFAGGEISGTPTFLGTMSWAGGDMNSAGTTSIAFGPSSTFTIGTSNYHDFYDSALVNGGVVDWTGGQIRTGNGGSFTNNGTFNDSASNSINNPWGGPAIFTNGLGATYNKTAPGETDVALPFADFGAVSVQAGVLNFQSGGTITSPGSMSTATGAVAQFSGGTFTVGSGSSLQGPGLYELTGGTLSVAGTATISSFLQLGGELAGSMSFNSTNFEWTAGDWDPAVSVTFGGASTLTIDTTNYHDIYTATVVNNGTVNWMAGQIRLGNGGSFTNNGTFNDSASNSINNPWGGPATFTNGLGATYNKTAIGVTTVGIPFTNLGTISISNGTLALSGGFTNTGGSLSLAGGAAVFPAAADFTSGSVLGSGTVTATTLTVGGVIAPAGPSGSGLLTVNGGLTLLGTTALEFNIGGTTPVTQFDQVAVTGAADLNGVLNITFNNGFQNSVTPSETFLILSSTSLSGSFVNAANGSQLMTADGLGWFTVNYGSSSTFAIDDVILSNFTPVPEPPTPFLLATGAAALFGLLGLQRLNAGGRDRGIGLVRRRRARGTST